MHGFIDQSPDGDRPAESCSENERRLGQRLAERWRAAGHEVRTERFT
jgi:hypothetical protein